MVWEKEKKRKSTLSVGEHVTRRERGGWGDGQRERERARGRPCTCLHMLDQPHLETL